MPTAIFGGLISSAGWIQALFFTAVMLGGCSSARSVETPPPESAPSTSEARSTVEVDSPEDAAENPCMTRCMQAVDNVEGCKKRCEIWSCIQDCLSNGGEEVACREGCGASPRGEKSECQIRCGMNSRLIYAECIEADGSDEQICRQSAKDVHEQCFAENCTEEGPVRP